MKELVCHSCREPLNIKDVNIAAGIGACRKCNTVTQFSGDNKNTHKPNINQVKGVTHYRNGMDFVIERSWKSAAVYFLIPFALFWNGFLLVWYGSLLRSGNAPLIAILFPLGHVAVGFGLIYTILSTLFNKTKITLGRSRMELRHGPLPWFGNINIPTSEIGQLFVREKTHRSKNSTRVSFTLILLNRSGKEINLIKSIDSYDQARKIEQEIEAALGIVDTNIPGEKRHRA